MYPTPYLGSDFYVAVTIIGFILLGILAFSVNAAVDRRAARRAAEARVKPGTGKRRKTDGPVLVDSRTGEVIESDPYLTNRS